MRSKKQIIKPLDNYHIHFLLVGFLLFLPFDILIFMTDYDSMLLGTVLVFNSVVVSIFVLVRIFFSARYVIDESSLTKYRGKNIVFRIKHKDIKKVLVKKGKIYSFFVFIFHFFCHVEPESNHMTNISLVFSNCEILKKERAEIVGTSLKTKDYNDFFEISDVISLRKAIKLCKCLNISPTFVN